MYPVRASSVWWQVITGGVPDFMEAMEQSLSGDLVTVVTYMPWCRSCHHVSPRQSRSSLDLPRRKLNGSIFLGIGMEREERKAGYTSILLLYLCRVLMLLYLPSPSYSRNKGFI